MNPYYYLFYRLSRLFNKKGKNELGPIGAISILLTANVAVAYFWLLPITQENVQGPYKTGFIALVIAILIANSILFLSKKRVSKIMNSYSGESARSRQIGGLFVILYVVLTFGLILFGVKPLN